LIISKKSISLKLLIYITVHFLCLPKENEPKEKAARRAVKEGALFLLLLLGKQKKENKITLPYGKFFCSNYINSADKITVPCTTSNYIQHNGDIDEKKCTPG
jgi:hypothetical protein